jgi:hypothetical protein
MSFFEGGRKTINQYDITTNQQAAIQGSGNFVSTGGLNNTGGTITFQSLDPLALSANENIATAAINASQKYVEFASESNRLGLATVGDVANKYADVAATVAGTGLTPEQISANKGTVAGVSSTTIGIGIAIVVGIGIWYYTTHK